MDRTERKEKGRITSLMAEEWQGAKPSSKTKLLPALRSRMYRQSGKRLESVRDIWISQETG